LERKTEKKVEGYFQLSFEIRILQRFPIDSTNGGCASRMYYSTGMLDVLYIRGVDELQDRGSSWRVN
jgi:hypothetical protein